MAYMAIGTGVLAIILAVISIISMWSVFGSINNALTELAGLAQRSLGVVDQGISEVTPILNRFERSMVEVQENGETLKAGIEESDPIIVALSTIVGEDVTPQVKEAQYKFIIYSLLMLIYIIFI